MLNHYVRYNKKQDLSQSKVRQMCIDNNFYTCGDNASYMRMFSLCDLFNKGEVQLSIIAGDIFAHSDGAEFEDYGFDTIYETIAWIMTLLERDCILTTYEAEEYEA